MLVVKDSSGYQQASRSYTCVTSITNTRNFIQLRTRTFAQPQAEAMKPHWVMMVCVLMQGSVEDGVGGFQACMRLVRVSASECACAECAVVQYL